MAQVLPAIVEDFYKENETKLREQYPDLNSFQSAVQELPEDKENPWQADMARELWSIAEKQGYSREQFDQVYGLGQAPQAAAQTTPQAQVQTTPNAQTPQQTDIAPTADNADDDGSLFDSVVGYYKDANRSLNEALGWNDDGKLIDSVAGQVKILGSNTVNSFVDKTAGSGVENVAKGISSLALVTGSESLVDLAKIVDGLAVEIDPENKPKTIDFTDIRTVKDFIIFFSNALGSVAGDVASAAVSGQVVGGIAAVGGLAIGGPPGAAVGYAAGVTSGVVLYGYVSSVGDTFSMLQQEGIPKQDAAVAAVLVGMPMAVLEKIGFKVIIKSLPAGSPLKHHLEKIISSFVVEGTTESLGAALQQGTAAYMTGNANISERAKAILNEGMLGAFGGAGTSSALSAVTAPFKRKGGATDDGGGVPNADVPVGEAPTTQQAPSDTPAPEAEPTSLARVHNVDIQNGIRKTIDPETMPQSLRVWMSVPGENPQLMRVDHAGGGAVKITNVKTDEILIFGTDELANIAFYSQSRQELADEIQQDEDKRKSADMDAESQRSIDAQAQMLGNDTSSKNTMEITIGSPMPSPGKLPDGVHKITRELANGDESTIFTTDDDVAFRLKSLQEVNKEITDEDIGQILYPGVDSKLDSDGTAIIVQDGDGAVVSEIATNFLNLEDALKAANDIKPDGGSVKVTTVNAVIENRKLQIKREKEEAVKAAKDERKPAVDTQQKPDGEVVQKPKPQGTKEAPLKAKSKAKAKKPRKKDHIFVQTGYNKQDEMPTGYVTTPSGKRIESVSEGRLDELADRSGGAGGSRYQKDPHKVFYNGVEIPPYKFNEEQKSAVEDAVSKTQPTKTKEKDDVKIQKKDGEGSEAISKKPAPKKHTDSTTRKPRRDDGAGDVSDVEKGKKRKKEVAKTKDKKEPPRRERKKKRAKKDAASYSTPPALVAKVAKNKDVIKAIEKIAKRILPESIKLEISDKLTDKQGNPIAGQYFENIVKVALAYDPINTINHETLHALRSLGLITKKEWGETVKQAVQENWIKKHNIRSRYNHLFDEDGKPTSKAIEEAVAHEFAAGAQSVGKEKSAIATLFERIRLFFMQLAKKLLGMGFETHNAYTLFRDIHSGKVAKRGAQSAQSDVSEQPVVMYNKGKMFVIPKSLVSLMEKVDGSISKAQFEQEYINSIAKKLKQNPKNEGIKLTLKMVTDTMNAVYGRESGKKKKVAVLDILNDIDSKMYRTTTEVAPTDGAAQSDTMPPGGKRKDIVFPIKFPAHLNEGEVTGSGWNQHHSGRNYIRMEIGRDIAQWVNWQGTMGVGIEDESLSEHTNENRYLELTEGLSDTAREDWLEENTDLITKDVTSTTAKEALRYLKENNPNVKWVGLPQSDEVIKIQGWRGDEFGNAVTIDQIMADHSEYRYLDSTPGEILDIQHYRNSLVIQNTNETFTYVEDVHYGYENVLNVLGVMWDDFLIDIRDLSILRSRNKKTDKNPVFSGYIDLLIERFPKIKVLSEKAYKEYEKTYKEHEKTFAPLSGDPIALKSLKQKRFQLWDDWDDARLDTDTKKIDAIENRQKKIDDEINAIENRATQLEAKLDEQFMEQLESYKEELRNLIEEIITDPEQQESYVEIDDDFGFIDGIPYLTEEIKEAPSRNDVLDDFNEFNDYDLDANTGTNESIEIDDDSKGVIRLYTKPEKGSSKGLQGLYPNTLEKVLGKKGIDTEAAREKGMEHPEASNDWLWFDVSNYKPNPYQDVMYAIPAPKEVRVGGKIRAELHPALKGTKVVDENGKPKIVYHGTTQKFDEFLESKKGTATKAPSAKLGFFFADRDDLDYDIHYNKELQKLQDEHNRLEQKAARTQKHTDFQALYKAIEKWEAAEQTVNTVYEKGFVLKTYLAIKNPFTHDYEGETYREETYFDIITKAKENGHDGVIFENTFDPGGINVISEPYTVYVAFSPDQIINADTGETMAVDTGKNIDTPQPTFSIAAKKALVSNEIWNSWTVPEKEMFHKNLMTYVKGLVTKMSPRGTRVIETGELIQEVAVGAYYPPAQGMVNGTIEVVTGEKGEEVGTAFHEIFHSIRRSLSDNEWNFLLKQSKKNDWAGRYAIKKRYGSPPTKKIIINPDGTLTDKGEEEAIADAFKDWGTGGKVFGKSLSAEAKAAESIFAKILRLLQQIAEYLAIKLRIIAKPDSVFMDIFNGEIRDRRTRYDTKGKPTPKKQSRPQHSLADILKIPDIEKDMESIEGESNKKKAKVILELLRDKKDLDGKPYIQNAGELNALEYLVEQARNYTEDKNAVQSLAKILDSLKDPDGKPYILAKTKTLNDVQNAAKAYLRDFDPEKQVVKTSQDGIGKYLDGLVKQGENALVPNENTLQLMEIYKSGQRESAIKQQVEQINTMRLESLKRLKEYLTDVTYLDPIGKAIVLKIANSFTVTKNSDETLKIVKISKDNTHDIADVVGGIAPILVRLVREGKKPKNALIEAYQEIKTLSEKETSHPKRGWVKFNKSAKISDGEKLNKACLGANRWCTSTGGSGVASSQLKKGDFLIYYDNHEPEIAIRMEGNSVAELAGRRNGDKQEILNDDYYDIAADKMKRDGYNAQGHIKNIRHRQGIRQYLDDEISFDDFIKVAPINYTLKNGDENIHLSDQYMRQIGHAGTSIPAKVMKAINAKAGDRFNDLKLADIKVLNDFELDSGTHKIAVVENVIGTGDSNITVEYVGGNVSGKNKSKIKVGKVGGTVLGHDKVNIRVEKVAGDVVGDGYSAIIVDNVAGYVSGSGNSNIKVGNVGKNVDGDEYSAIIVENVAGYVFGHDKVNIRVEKVGKDVEGRDESDIQAQEVGGNVLGLDKVNIRVEKVGKNVDGNGDSTIKVDEVEGKVIGSGNSKIKVDEVEGKVIGWGNSNIKVGKVGGTVLGHDKVNIRVEKVAGDVVGRDESDIQAQEVGGDVRGMEDSTIIARMVAGDVLGREKSDIQAQEVEGKVIGWGNSNIKVGDVAGFVFGHDKVNIRVEKVGKNVDGNGYSAIIVDNVAGYVSGRGNSNIKVGDVGRSVVGEQNSNINAGDVGRDVLGRGNSNIKVGNVGGKVIGNDESNITAKTAKSLQNKGTGKVVVETITGAAESTPMFSLPDNKTHVAFSKPASEKDWRNRPTQAEGNLRNAAKDLSQKDYDLLARYVLLHDLIQVGSENIALYPFHLDNPKEAYREFELVDSAVAQNKKVLKTLNDYVAWLNDPKNKSKIRPTDAKARIKQIMPALIEKHPKIQKRMQEIATALSEKKSAENGKDKNVITGEARTKLKGEARKLRLKLLSEYKDWHIKPESKLDAARRVMNDEFRAILATIRAIEKQYGIVLPTSLSAYQQEVLIYSASQNETEQYHEKYMKPLMESMVKNGVDFDDLHRYALALHAQERNAEIKRKDPDRENGSGITDQEAQDILSRDPNALWILAPKIKDNAKMLKAFQEPYTLLQEMVKYYRDLLIESGLYDKASMDKWPKYEFYVPLQGFEKDYPTIGRTSGGKKGVRGKEIKQAKGRSSLSENSIAILHDLIAKTISRKYKNKVFRAYGRMAAKYPNPSLYRVHTAKNAPKHVSNPSNELVVAYKDKDDNGRVVQYYIELIGKTGALNARALKRAGPAGVGDFIKYASRIMRYLAMTRTVFYPDFLITNVERDYMTGVISLIAESTKGKGYTGLLSEGSTLKIALKALNPINHARFMLGMRDLLRDANKGGKLKGKRLEYYNNAKLFRENGSMLGALAIYDIETARKNLEREFRRLKGGGMANIENAGLALNKAIWDYADTLENTARLKAFVIAVEVLTQARQPELDAASTERKAEIMLEIHQTSAYIAKNSTVNFNKRGEAGNILAIWSLFWAAALASLRWFGRVAKSPGAQVALAMLFIGGFIEALIGTHFGESDEDDDKRNDYEQIPNYAIERVAVLAGITNPGKGMWLVNLAHEYNVFWNFGRKSYQLYEYYADNYTLAEGKSPSEFFPEVISTALNSFLSLGFNEAIDREGNLNMGGTILKTVLPTLISPTLEQELNSNFFGGEILRPDPYPNEVAEPDAYRDKQYTDQFWKDFAQWLNRVSGGDEETSGWADVHPETIKAQIEFLYGGTGKFLIQMFQIAKKLESGEEIKIREIPVLRRHFVDPKNYLNRYRDLSNVIKSLDWLVLKMARAKENGDYRKRDKLRTEHKDEWVVLNKLTRARKSVKSLYKRAQSSTNEKTKKRLRGEAAALIHAATTEAKRELNRINKEKTVY